jgi:hypothetical protein
VIAPPPPPKAFDLYKVLFDTGLVTSVDQVGSQVTCSPSPEGTDRDYLVLVHSQDLNAQERFIQKVQHAGFTQTIKEVVSPNSLHGSNGVFASFRHGEINLIVTTCEHFHRRFLAATSVAKRLNLLQKSDRIALFQAVLYGNIDGDIALLSLDKSARERLIEATN